MAAKKIEAHVCHEKHVRLNLINARRKDCFLLSLEKNRETGNNCTAASCASYCLLNEHVHRCRRMFPIFTILIVVPFSDFFEASTRRQKAKQMACCHELRTCSMKMQVNTGLGVRPHCL
jgi:hypothetical protein